MFDAIIKEMLRFIDERNKDMETSELREKIELILSGELMANAHLDLVEWTKHVSKRIIVELTEMSRLYKTP